MRVVSGTFEYEVDELGGLVADNGQTRLYLCEEVETGRQCLLKIAASLAYNGGLDREAYILRELKRLSDDVDAAYAESKGNPDRRLNYDRLFPDLVDSFVSQDQGKRRINIVAFREVEAVTSMVPLSYLAAKDRLRVDLRTSAWIMGRLLKLLGFVHHQGIAVRTVSGNNILLGPERHHAVIFDWSSARFYQGEIPGEARKDDIAKAAMAVLKALGSDPATGNIPDVDEKSRKYAEYLLHLASHREIDAERAHRKFYDIVDELWERKYYPFTTTPLD